MKGDVRMKRKALIVQGGWTGHEPVEVSEVFRNTLEECDFEVEVSDTLDAFLDVEKLRSLHLIIPVWTMGKITPEQMWPVIEAVAEGVGIAGCHGGMCDAFRDCVQWQFMTGGNWVTLLEDQSLLKRREIKNGKKCLCPMDMLKIAGELELLIWLMLFVLEEVIGLMESLLIMYWMLCMHSTMLLKKESTSWCRVHASVQQLCL